jgi:hypothetical protein
MMPNFYRVTNFVFLQMWTRIFYRNQTWQVWCQICKQSFLYVHADSEYVKKNEIRQIWCQISTYTSLMIYFFQLLYAINVNVDF